MKRNVLVALALAVGTAAFAIDPVNPKMAVLTNNTTGVFKVVYEGVQGSSVKINVLNKAGKKVFSETIRGVEGFVLPLNFNGMEKGQYVIEVLDGNGRQAQVVNYATGVAPANVHVARIKGEDQKYLLAVATKGEDVIKVRIFDGNQVQVHEENLTVAQELGRVYNLKQVVGAPTFEITDKSGNTRVIRY
jgi:hypothetical protein